MIVEVKAKVARIINGKTRKKTETFIKENCTLFTEAEYAVTELLTEEQNSKLVDNFEIQSLRISPIKEVYTSWKNDKDNTFVATLIDIFLEDNGTEKATKYKILLWANNHTEALKRVQELSKQGYDMQIEGIKQVDYTHFDKD